MGDGMGAPAPFEKESLDGEISWADMGAEKRCDRLDSGRGEVCEVAKDTDLAERLLNSALFRAPSKLRMLCALFGVDL